MYMLNLQTTKCRGNELHTHTSVIQYMHKLHNDIRCNKLCVIIVLYCIVLYCIVLYCIVL